MDECQFQMRVEMYTEERLIDKMLLMILDVIFDYLISNLLLPYTLSLINFTS